MNNTRLEGIRWTGLSTAVIVILQVIQLVLFARILTPEAIGLMGLVTIIFSIAILFVDAGIGPAIVHFPNLPQSQKSTLFWSMVGIGCILSLTMWILAPFFAFLFRNASITLFIRVIAPTIAIISIGKMGEFLLLKFFHFRAIATSEIIAALISFFVAMLALFQGGGAWAMAIGFFGFLCIRSIFLALYAQFIPSRPSFGNNAAVMRFGLFQIGERFINLLAERLDQLIIGRVAGIETLGYYNMAATCSVQPVQRLNPIITRVALPTIALLQKKPPEIRSAYLSVIRTVFFINAPLLLGCMILAKDIIITILGPKWLPALPLLQGLCIISLFRAGGNPSGTLLLAMGRADIGFYWNIVLLLANSVAVYFGAIINGAQGVVIGLLCVQMLLVVPAYYSQIRPLTGPCGLKFIQSQFTAIIGSALMVVVLWFCNHSLIHLQPALRLALEVGIGIITYAAFMWFLDRRTLLSCLQVLKKS